MCPESFLNEMHFDVIAVIIGGPLEPVDELITIAAQLHGFWLMMPFCRVTAKLLNECLEICLSRKFDALRAFIIVYPYVDSESLSVHNSFFKNPPTSKPLACDWGI